jgi:hypothetical protein
LTFPATAPVIAATITDSHVCVLEDSGHARRITLADHTLLTAIDEPVLAADGLQGVLAWTMTNACAWLDASAPDHTARCALPDTAESIALDRSLLRVWAAAASSRTLFAIALDAARPRIERRIEIVSESFTRIDVLRGFEGCVALHCYENQDEQELLFLDSLTYVCTQRLASELPIVCTRDRLVTYDHAGYEIVVRDAQLRERCRFACELPDGDWLDPHSAALVGDTWLVLSSENGRLHLLALGQGTGEQPLTEPAALALAQGPLVPTADAGVLRWQKKRTDETAVTQLEWWANAAE